LAFNHCFLRARLDALRKIGLCAYGDGGYRLKDGWADALNANGRYNAFLAAREALRYTPREAFRLYSGDAGKIAGKVTKVYRTDGDASDNHAVVLEALDGKAYFVPLFKAPEAWDKGERKPLAEGDFLAIQPRENQKGRLTPSMYKTGERSLRRLAAAGKHTGPLAAEIAAGKDRASEKTRSKKND
jgi:hypothetical protein